jgi:hypothetical protein
MKRPSPLPVLLRVDVEKQGDGRDPGGPAARAAEAGPASGSIGEGEPAMNLRAPSVRTPRRAHAPPNTPNTRLEAGPPWGVVLPQLRSSP